MLFLSKFKSTLTHNLLNIPGWNTKRKIVVIESDDWGSIRMASKKSFNYFKKLGYPVDQCPYNSYDALECNEDLEMLFEVLSSVKDKNGHMAILTANHLVANPDFERIKASGYQEYHYELFIETLKRYTQHDRVFSLYNEGIERLLFRPQSHGREHLNVRRWMFSLREGNQASLDAFGQHMFSVHPLYDRGNKNEFMDSFDYDHPEDVGYIESLVKDGLKLFRETWGFQSKSFIASCYIWNSSLEKILSAEGVKYIQGMVIQSEPTTEPGTFNYKKRYHYQGQKNRYGQRYLIRNAFFEPSHDPAFDWVENCLNRIKTAFSWRKPAIISTHRVNFMGFIDPSNRERNIKLFKQLLSEIVKRWPDVEFMTSDQLGDLMQENVTI